VTLLFCCCFPTLF